MENSTVTPLVQPGAFCELLGHYLNHNNTAAALAWASAALHGLIKPSIDLGLDELAMVAGRDQIAAPERMFPVERLD